MKNADIAKKNYDAGFWTLEMLATLVRRGKLTEVDYLEIAGQVYPAAAEAGNTSG